MLLKTVVMLNIVLFSSSENQDTTIQSFWLSNVFKKYYFHLARMH